MFQVFLTKRLINFSSYPRINVVQASPEVLLNRLGKHSADGGAPGNEYRFSRIPFQGSGGCHNRSNDSVRDVIIGERPREGQARKGN